MLLAEINLGDVLWSMIVFFCFFIWIMLLFQVFGDLFRDKTESGVAKTLWIIFVVVAPFLGVFIYLIVRGQGMADRNIEAAKAADAQMASYVRNVSGSGGATEEIARGKELLDSGAITQAEFDTIKAKALG